MASKWLRYIYCGILLVTIWACANRGRPSGGPVDKAAPVITRVVPENYSTNFDAKEIRIYFDEFIQVKNLQKQLIISPPMDVDPTITPQGSSAKFIKIVINDTLKDNTTYAFNFGQSIVDNNEENPYDYYRYVFSTGSEIDSLSVRGTIVDAEKLEADNFVSVMLYELDSTYNDSTVYKKKPKYITNTLDSLTTFSIDNISEGQYKLIALKDENGNFTYQQKSDKIGFYEGIVNVPSDTTYTLKLFKEELDFDVKRPRQVAGQKIAFGFEGNSENMRIKLLDSSKVNVEARITKDRKSDTLFYWYKPKIELDSVLFLVTNKTFSDTLVHKFRDIEKDSLVISVVKSGTLNFNEQFEVGANVPLSKIDESQISILNKDSLNVPFSTIFNPLENTYRFKFEMEESENYAIKMFPNSFEDFFGQVNDTLDFKVRTKTFSDYTNIRVKLVNAVYPVIVQLTDDKGEVKYEQFARDEQLFDFKNLDPNKYYLRVVYDTNGNQRWDSGNYLMQRQPERISYAEGFIDGRAGWDYPEEVFTLD